MKDVEILNKIIFEPLGNNEYIYNNKVILEIELNRISDPRLVIGLLVSLHSNQKSYEISNPQVIIETMSLFTNEKTTADYLGDCYRLFQEEMKKPSSNSPLDRIPSLEKCLALCEMIMDPKDDHISTIDLPNFVAGVKALTPKDVEVLKSLLLEQEMFEILVDVENILKKIN